MVPNLSVCNPSYRTPVMALLNLQGLELVMHGPELLLLLTDIAKRLVAMAWADMVTILQAALHPYGDP